MQLLDHKNTKYSTSEVFFIEKSIELLHRKTIDTFRARVMNPRTILVELKNLLEDDRIINSKAYEYAILETRSLLIDEYETTLAFNIISKNHFIGLISELLKTGAPLLRKKIPLVIESIILENNKTYAQNLLEEIKQHLGKYDNKVSVDELIDYFNKLSKLTSFFITDLISRKFSKRFLYRFFSNLFTSKELIDFSDGVVKLSALLTITPKQYVIVFKVVMPPELAKNITLIQATDISVETSLTDIIEKTKSRSRQKVEAFANKGFRSPHFVVVKVDALDAFTALEMARVILAENLDIIHFGYSNESVYPDKTVLIIHPSDKTNDHYVQSKPLHYEMDGDFKDGVDLYDDFSKLLSNINQKQEIKRATKEKLKSSIRYLRLGNEAVEVEHKFLNYWIAVEYLFTDLKDKSDINDIKKFFSRLHANIYLKRLIKDFHENIIRLKRFSIPGFDTTNLSYLEAVDTYDYIIENFRTDFPLLAHRAASLKLLLFEVIDKKKPTHLEKLIEGHTQDLELHLSRMYRIRNTIIHNAAINMDIISTTSNLRYYLTFTIVTLIKELTVNASLQCIEDVFITQETQFNSLKEEKFKKEKLLNVPTNFDFII